MNPIMDDLDAPEFVERGNVDDRTIELVTSECRKEIRAAGQDSGVGVSQKIQCVGEAIRSEKQRKSLLDARPMARLVSKREKMILYFYNEHKHL